MTEGQRVVAHEGSSVPGQARPPCTAVIVTYQSSDHIGALLEALQSERETGLDLEVIVVDNASSDDTTSVVSRFSWVRLVHSGGNLGYAAGVNVGSRLVPRDRAVLVLNPDLIPDPGALGILLDGLRRAGAGVVVPRVENADGSLCPSLRNEPSIRRAFVDGLLGARSARLPRGWSVLIWDEQVYEREQEADWAVGAILLVSPACRREVGDWDERYFLYCEETDYLRRVREAGFRVVYTPDAVVRHIGGGSGTSDGLYALLALNSIRYYRRHHGPATSAVFSSAVVLHQLVRLRRPAARLALRALVSTEARAALPHPTGSVISEPTDG